MGYSEQSVRAALFNGRSKALVTAEVDTSALLRFSLPMAPTALRDPYRQNPWIHAALRAIATPASSIPIRFARTMPGSEKREMLPENNPLQQLFQRPNGVMSQADLWETWHVAMNLDGLHYWVFHVDGRPVALGEVPNEIWPIRRKFVRQVRDTGGGMVKVRAYVLNIDGTEIAYQPWQVGVFRFFDPADPLGGLAPVEVVMRAAKMELSSDTWLQALFENGCEPGLLITMKEDLMPKQREEFLSSWEARYRGAEKRGRPAVLGGGADVREIGKTPRDMDFLEARRWFQQQIISALGVTPFDIGVINDVNRATALASQRQTLEKKIIPDLRRIERQVQRFISSWSGMEGIVPVFDLAGVESLKEDDESKLLRARSLRDLGIPINEVISKLNLGVDQLDPVLGGVPLVTFGLQKLAEVTLEEPPFSPLGQEDKPEELTPEEQAEQAEREPAPQATDDDDESATLDDGFAKGLGPVFARAEPGKVMSVMLKRIHEPGTKRMRTKIRRVFFGIRKEVLERLDDLTRSKQSGLTPEAIAAVLWAKELWDEILRDQLRPTYRFVLGNALSQIESELGGFSAFSIGSPSALQIMERRLIQVTQILDTTRERLRSSLVVGLANGETLDGLRIRIQQAMNAASSRATTIARTETAVTANAARFAAMDAEGVEMHEWVPQIDNFTRMTHRERHPAITPEGPAVAGQKVRVGEQFANGLLHPGDPQSSNAGEVINCRCAALLAL